MSRVCRVTYQKFFESAYILSIFAVSLTRAVAVLVPAPEVYQWSALSSFFYAFSATVASTHLLADVYGNKLNENGKLQIRCLVASTTRLYNVKINTPGMEMERKAQWAFPIAALVALVTYGDNPLVWPIAWAPSCFLRSLLIHTPPPFLRCFPFALHQRLL